MSSNNKENSKPPHPLRLLHRHGGIVAALLVIVICVTGILLNHTDDLGLAKRNVRAAWLLNAYGIKPPEIRSFAVDEHFITHSGSSLWFDDEQLNGNFAVLAGAHRNPDGIFVAVDDKLLWLDSQGELLETLQTYAGLPPGISKMGHMADNDQLIVAASSGLFTPDDNYMRWLALPAGTAGLWATETTDLPAKYQKSIENALIGDGLTVEHLILELHSGRIIGGWGRALADIAALLFIILAASGIWMWFKSRRR